MDASTTKFKSDRFQCATCEATFSKMKITVRSSDIVEPATLSPSRQLWLSGMDLAFPEYYYVKAFYLYKTDGGPDFLGSKELKSSLSKVLDVFYPLAGRVCRDSSGRLQIHCSGQGVRFVEATTESALQDLGCTFDDFALNPETAELCPTVDVDYSLDYSSVPLLHVQVTWFKCGGIGLGLSLRHTVADGIAAMNFVNTWSDVARGLDVKIPPLIDRTLLKPRNPPNSEFNHLEYAPLPPLRTQNPETSSNDSSAVMLKLSGTQIWALKRKYGSNNKYSRFVVIAAHILLCICRARNYQDDQLIRVRITIDCRRRLNPPLPDEFFGNAVITATSEVFAKDVMREDGDFAVNTVIQTISKRDDFVRSAIDYLENADVNVLTVRGDTMVKIVSWISLPFYEADFGWGRPLYAGRVGTPPGAFYLFRDPAEADAVWISYTGSNKLMDRFKLFFYNEVE